VKGTVPMRGFDPATSFLGNTATHYDDELRGDEVQTVDFFEKLANGGNVLELAIGTGRIAVPLSQRGISVTGIELSPDMIAVLRTKADAKSITVHQGDMSNFELPEKFDLIYLIFNTISNLLTQDEQVRCFECASRHLTNSGVFVIEINTIAWFYALKDNQHVNAEVVDASKVTLDVATFNPVTQILDENHVTLSETGIHLGPIVQRLSSHAEFDLMARIAGLQLKDRWGGWKGEPFTAESKRHVSVYGK
jgi:SAM-dependent methyltransferase